LLKFQAVGKGAWLYFNGLFIKEQEE